MKEPKHRMPRLRGPRHLARLRLSTVVRLLEFERAELGAEAETHEWFEAREARMLELGARS
jgi:hypothetical protein